MIHEKCATVGVPAEEKEKVLMDIHNELTLMFNDAKREVMREVLGIKSLKG